MKTNSRKREKSPAMLVLLGYRLLLSLSLLSVTISGLGMELLAGNSAQIFINTTYLYALVTIVSCFAYFLYWCRNEIQAQAMFMIDAIAVPILMYAGSGVISGLGGLLAVSIALTSLILPGRLVLFLAAFATFSIFTQQIYISKIGNMSAEVLTNAGLLGAAYFAIAALAATLTKKLGESERLAQQRAVDLADMAKLNELIIQEMSTGVVVSDEQGSILYINDAALKLLNLPKSPHPNSLEASLPELESHRRIWLESGLSSTVFPISSGPTQLRTHYRSSGIGNNRGALILMDDASEAARQAQQIKLASLGRLTASIAHQIRNPLSSISHAGQLLEESPHFSPSDRRLTTIIRNNSKRVNETIESILQLSRREKSVKERIPLAHWLKNFIHDFKQEHPQCSIDLQLADASLEQRVIADGVQLFQIIGNLCENALKHGGSGDGEAAIQLRLDVTPFAELTLDISDQGKGFSKESRQNLFEPFFTTRSDGTGLGLYIAKELSDANNIQISLLKSQQGAHFHLQFQSDNP